MLDRKIGSASFDINRPKRNPGDPVDAYFSADVETDGPIPGPFSMLSFALVYAGTFDGDRFVDRAHTSEFFTLSCVRYLRTFRSKRF